MKTENEKWADDIMSSIDGIHQAEPSPFLYNKILNKISIALVEYTPKKLVWLAAASFALLIILNLQAFKKHTANSHNKSSAEELANQYQLLNNNTINYN